MEMPQETVVWYLIPAIRKQLVLELKKHGMPQKHIASKLQITGAAVSQYIHNKRANNGIQLTPKVLNESTISAKKIMVSQDEREVFKEMMRLVGLSIRAGVLCDRCHLKQQNCQLCMLKG